MLLGKYEHMRILKLKTLKLTWCYRYFSRHLCWLSFQDVCPSLEERISTYVDPRPLNLQMQGVFQNTVVNVPHQVTFRMALSKKIIIAVTEVVLIQMSFLTIGKKEHTEYHDIFTLFKTQVYIVVLFFSCLDHGVWYCIITFE